MVIYRLAYLSTSLIGADLEIEQKAIADILLTSRRCNESVQVTGALLVTAQNFAQVLEGERLDLDGVYARIKRGPASQGSRAVRHRADRRATISGMVDGGRSQSAEEAVQRDAGNLPASNPGEVARGLVSYMSRTLADPLAG